MENIVLLFACLAIGMLLNHGKVLPANAPATINGFIIHVSLPALILKYIHTVELRSELITAVAMPWVLFLIGAAVFWSIGKVWRLSRPTTGALILMGGLGNTSFIGLPMIEAFYGPALLSIGILIDQLGTYLVLSTLGIAVATIYSESTSSWRNIATRIASFPPLIAMVIALALIPVSYPDWLGVILHRLGGTLAPLALVSIGLQLRASSLAGNRRALAMGLSYKLLIGPAILAALYVSLLQGKGVIAQITLFEAAMAPQIGASIIAIQNNLNPPLVTLMVGYGTILSFATLSFWYYILQAI